jgi:hypothetical protein
MEDQIEETPPAIVETPKASKYSPSQIALFLGGIIFLLVLVGAAFTAFKSSSNNQNANNIPQADTVKPINLAPYSLVYGSWTTDSSEINALDLSSGKQYLLASLPTNIKKVTVLDNNKLLYINKTNSQDYGQEIDTYDIQNKASIPIIKAADGFGIDDYVISPNKQYIAIWEVATDPSTNVLLNGKSRIYTANLSNPTAMHLIYDEKADSPIHYPSGILNNGTLYADTFLPNSGAGWAYGMSVSDFTGTNKQDLAAMKNGTYGTQPELSPDGKYFVFAGYDGNKGDGTKEVNDYRQALLTPDTVELLDTSTNQRTKLSGVSNADTYTTASWDTQNGHVIYTRLSGDKNNTGVYEYDLTTKKSTNVNLPENSQNNVVLVASLSDNAALLAQQNNSLSDVGNLGSSYAQTYSQLSVIDQSTKKTTSLSLPTATLQFIGLTPPSYFTSAKQLDNVLTNKAANNQLQLQTFVLKPSLAPVRLVQHADPPNITVAPVKGTQPAPTQPQQKAKGSTCASITENQCKAKYPDTGGTNTDYANCLFNTNASGKTSPSGPSGTCDMTPLYLYGTPGTQVSVKILTPVFGSSPTYSNGYDIVLGNNGVMNINGNTYTKIAYSYTPAVRRITPPIYGTIVAKEKVRQTLTEYANKLGLNQKETENLITDSLSQLSSPYIFVSFFDNQISKQILPISFSPKPDVYHNIVFYFKQLNQKPTYSIQPPIFERINRHDFTAVEISEIVE